MARLRSGKSEHPDPVCDLSPIYGVRRDVFVFAFVFVFVRTSRFGFISSHVTSEGRGGSRTTSSSSQ